MTRKKGHVEPIVKIDTSDLFKINNSIEQQFDKQISEKNTKVTSSKSSCESVKTKPADQVFSRKNREDLTRTSNNIKVDVTQDEVKTNKMDYSSISYLPEGLTPTRLLQLKALSCLSDNGSLKKSISDIGKSMNLGSTAVKKMVKDLIKSGFLKIEKEFDPSSKTPKTYQIIEP